MTNTHNEISGTVSGNVIQAGHIDQVTVNAALPLAMSGLPAGTTRFVGRVRLLTEIATLLDDDGPIVISGAPGVGKTALALHIAHAAIRNGRFPGGVLFADLRGYHPAPTDPTETLTTFVQSLGLPPDQIPVGHSALETAYRSLLARHGADAGRVLVVLDNASSAAQIRPLLPGSGSHRVVVTSRHRLADLDGVRPVHLDVLDVDDAVSLLAAGESRDDRLRRESAAMREVAALCGHLPLALRIVTALLLDDPGRPVSEAARALRDERHRLAELEYGDDLAVRAAFDLSYARLSVAERRMFRLLSRAPGQRVSDWTAGALAGIQTHDATRLLAALCRASMLHPSDIRGWYQFHDLIRLYAAEKSAQEDSPEEVDDAIERMLVEYYAIAEECLDKLSSRHDNLADIVEHRNTFSTWLAIERPALIEVVDIAQRYGSHLFAAQLASNVSRYLRDTRRWAEAATMVEMGIRSARQRYPEYEATLRCDLASALVFLGREQECLGHLTRAAEIAATLGNRRLEGVIMLELGAEHSRLGNIATSLEHYRAALQIAVDASDVLQQGNIQISIGAALEKAGNVGGALDQFNRGLLLFHQADARSSIASTERLIAGVYLNRLNRHDLACDHYLEAQKICRDIGDHHSEAEIWHQLCRICIRDGNLEMATTAWRSAMLLASRIDYGDLIKDLELMSTMFGLAEIATGNSAASL
ncbi:NB-ARC domain-containing protein [Micromonospora haikouensis]|uniref:NB-ARC domain-containing protein n=1 Tax=Micromonospora haikouensis TaxID=686309 RepID=UPI003D75F0C8